MTTAAASLQRAGRPPRDSRLEPYMRSQAMWGTIMALVGMRHAGDDPDPRPLPQTTLYEVKRRCVAGAPSGRGPVPEALYFAFYADCYRVAPERAVTMPPEHLWWLAASHDTVLLSDRVTHHYTEIATVDREQERISFYEFWPDDFFLLPGRNTLGAAARLDPGLSISKAEFLRAAAGLVTWDTPRLVQSYFAAFPERRADPDVLVRFGFALLDAEADPLAAVAAPLFAEAVRLGEAAGGPGVDLAARQAYLAACCGAYEAVARGNKRALEATQAILQLVVRERGRAALEAGLSARELTRFGRAAANAQDLEVACAVLDQAIARDPDFEDSYWFRASAHLLSGDPTAAIRDAEHALALNAAALERLAAERAALDPRGRVELDWQDQQIAGRRGQRASELAVLLEACGELADFTRAGATVVSERAAGRPAEATSALRAVIARERDTARRASYGSLLAEVAPPGRRSMPNY